METNSEEPLKALKDQVVEYAELKTEQARLGLIENTAKISGYISAAFVITLLILLALFSLFVAGALYLGQWLHNYALGFLISAGINTLLLLLFIAFGKKGLERSVTNKIIEITHKKD